jgi:1-aminocyclopropane-1-carboxylate deaminase/D-cysteine desulfhydrase-like pyridoxal-dependent ACC family enzyme
MSSIQELREALARFPRVPLAEIPTPLHECPRLAGAIGVRRLFLKRDDLTGLAFGGNKTRKFALTFADALQEGADCVITGAASQSNHARQAAAAAARLGLKAYLVNQYDRRAEMGIQGNWLLNCLLDAEIRLVAPGLDPGQVRQQLAEELRAAGHRPYVIGERAAILGAVAYAECALEVAEQLAAAGVRADVLAMASGAGTQAGLALGAKALQTGWRVMGYRPGHADPVPIHESITGLANAAAAWMDLETRLSPEEIDNSGEFVGEAYGIPTLAGLEAVHLTARTEGILLDPVYTGKAMSGLIAAVQRGEVPRDATIVFVHTGGAPALFAYQSDLVAHGCYPTRIVEDLSQGIL